VDPEKTQAKEEEEKKTTQKTSVCVCCVSFVSRSLSLSRAFDIVSFHFFLLASGVSLRSLQVQDLLLQFFFASREVFGGDFYVVLRGLLSREAGQGGGKLGAREGKLERER
jgi:hypothetical protein